MRKLTLTLILLLSAACGGLEEAAVCHVDDLIGWRMTFQVTKINGVWVPPDMIEPSTITVNRLYESEEFKLATGAPCTATVEVSEDRCELSMVTECEVEGLYVHLVTLTQQGPNYVDGTESFLYRVAGDIYSWDMDVWASLDIGSSID